MPKDVTGTSAASHLALSSDLQLIADMVAPNSRVLDIGCEDGRLLNHLWRTKGVDGRGIEIDVDNVRAALARGLAVIQGDAETDLNDYPDGAFDYAILGQTLQAMQDPKMVLGNLVRIGRRAIVSFPNMGYWRVRLSLLAYGRMPVSQSLPHSWYATPNLHLCSLLDFADLCGEMGITIERSLILGRRGPARPMGVGPWANLVGEQAVVLLSRP